MIVKNNNNNDNNQMIKTNQLHVITENGEQCFMWRSNQLTYIAQDRQEIPLVLATKFGSLATKLDLSYNTLTSYKNINLFTNLSELILDNNHLHDEQLFNGFKQNLKLKTLSLNKNRLNNLPRLINLIKVHYPNLEFLSLIGNPLCPTPICLIENNNEQNSNNKELRSRDSSSLGSSTINQVIDRQSDDFEYQRYRHFIIYHLPNLRFLDSKPISNEERDESLRRCFWMEVAKPNETMSLNENDLNHASRNNKITASQKEFCNNNNNNISNGPTTSSSRINNNNNNNNHTSDLAATDSFNLTIMSDYSNDDGFNEQQAPPGTNIIQPKGQRKAERSACMLARSTGLILNSSSASSNQKLY